MPTPRITNEKISQIAALYKAGKDVAAIETEVGVSRPTVYKYISLAGGPTRYAPRPKHSTWHEAFDVLTRDAAYWVGLLMTDGSLVDGGKRIKLALDQADVPSLERFKAFVRTSAPVEPPDNGARTVRFTSMKMSARLRALGVVPLKTYTATAPDVLLASSDFWRGVFDGDGTIVLGDAPGESPGIKLTGHSGSRLLPQWVKACEREIGVLPVIYPRENAPTVSDAVVMGAPSLKALNWLYSDLDAVVPPLERKLNAYHQLLALHAHRPVSPSGRFAWGSKRAVHSLDEYREINELVIPPDKWASIRAASHNTEHLAQSLCDASEGLPMPFADLTEKSAQTAFTALKNTPLTDLLEEGQIKLLRSPAAPQPGYRTRLRPPGNNSSNYFFNHERLKTPKNNLPSAWDKWHDRKERLAVFRRLLHLKHVTHIDNTSIRLALYMTGATPAQFKPGVAKAVYELTDARHILDFSMGWGDRLAGFCASPRALSYTGIDPNAALHPLYKRQLDLYGQGKQVTLIAEPAESCAIPAGSYDLVFTSPPYFGAERYASGSPSERLQSWHRYPTPESWRDCFLKPVLARVWDALSEGGVLAINLADVATNRRHVPLCSWLQEIVASLPRARFQFALGMRLQGANYTQDQRAEVTGEPIWMWTKGDRQLPVTLSGLRPDTQPPSQLLPPPVPSPTPLTKNKENRGSPRTPSHVEEQVVAAYDAGEGSTTIARRHGLSSPTIGRILGRYGRNRRAFTPRPKAYLAQENKKPPANAEGS